MVIRGRGVTAHLDCEFPHGPHSVVAYDGMPFRWSPLLPEPYRTGESRLG